MSTAAEAVNASRGLNKKFFNGSQINVALQSFFTLDDKRNAVKIFVAGLPDPDTYDAEDLRLEFEKYGTVTRSGFSFDWTFILLKCLSIWLISETKNKTLINSNEILSGDLFEYFLLKFPFTQ